MSIFVKMNYSRSWFLLLCLPLLAFIPDFSEVCGKYFGGKDDYNTEIKLYDDSVFSYTASREFPFEVSEGKWTLVGDTVILNTTPCQNPELLEHVPKRTYITFTNARYLYKKAALYPVVNGKLVKSEILQKEK